MRPVVRDAERVLEDVHGVEGEKAVVPVSLGAPGPLGAAPALPEHSFQTQTSAEIQFLGRGMTLYWLYPV